MTRHPACLCLVLLAALVACGGPPRDATAPPPITADTTAEPSPSPSPSAAPVPSPTTAPAADSLPPQPPTPATTTTSAPGAIPPAPLPGGAGVPPTPSPEPPLQWLHEKEARKADYDRKVRDAEAAVAAARPEVDRWEKNVLAIQNPFLPPPKFTDEEAEATKGMRNVDRLKFAQDRLAEAKQKLADAQKTLDDLKANPVSL